MVIKDKSAPLINRLEERTSTDFSFFKLCVIAKKVIPKNRKGTKLTRESNLDTEKTLDSSIARIKRTTGKSKGVLLMLTFSLKKVLALNKSNKDSPTKTTSACLGSVKKSVVKFVKKSGKRINKRPSRATDALSI